MLVPQVPQLIENYRGQSAEGISLRFLGIWMLGDLTNLIGALYGGLYVQRTSFAWAFRFLLFTQEFRVECLIAHSSGACHKPQLLPYFKLRYSFSRELC